MIKLEITKRTDPRLLERMKNHYSQPKGFVGRNICYAVYYDNQYYGHIVGGSATLNLPNRNEFFGITKKDLNSVVNNIFFNVSKINRSYPVRNFTTKIVSSFSHRIKNDWKEKYGDEIVGIETLVELPRKGELYLKDKFEIIGITKGYTCKRVSGKSTDSYTGRRVWNHTDLKPKLVLAKKI